MNEEILIKIDEEIAALLAEVARLQAARKALRGGSGMMGPTLTRAKDEPPTRRAPKGALEAAMLKTLKAHPGLTNQEIRGQLAKDGYRFALSSLHVGKRLMALVEAKKLTVKLDGALRRYHAAK